MPGRSTTWSSSTVCSSPRFTCAPGSRTPRSPNWSAPPTPPSPAPSARSAHCRRRAASPSPTVPIPDCAPWRTCSPTPRPRGSGSGSTAPRPRSAARRPAGPDDGGVFEALLDGVIAEAAKWGEIGLQVAADASRISGTGATPARRSEVPKAPMSPPVSAMNSAARAYPSASAPSGSTSRPTPTPDGPRGDASGARTRCSPRAAAAQVAAPTALLIGLCLVVWLRSLDPITTLKDRRGEIMDRTMWDGVEKLRGWLDAEDQAAAGDVRLLRVLKIAEEAQSPEWEKSGRRSRRVDVRKHQIAPNGAGCGDSVSPRTRPRAGSEPRRRPG